MIYKIRFPLLFLLWTVPACAQSSRVPTTDSTKNGWSVGDPVMLQLDTARLAEHRRLCIDSGADACLVAYRGQIVQEWYGPQYSYPMYSMSSVKSWTGLLAGLLIADGKLELDQPVSRYLPEWEPASRVTLRHLLTMTAGLKRRSGREGPDRSIGFVQDKFSFMTSLPLSYTPGEKWDYSNEGAQLLSPILQRAAGQPLERYAEERLFRPLGMDSTRLRVYPAGQPWTYADAETTLRDFASVCQAMLNGGQWKGKQVIPSDWVIASVTPIPQNPEYGLLWWLLPGGFATKGYLNTDCYVVRDKHIVVARMQSKPKQNSKPYWSPATWQLFHDFVRRN